MEPQFRFHLTLHAGSAQIRFEPRGNPLPPVHHSRSPSFPPENRKLAAKSDRWFSAPRAETLPDLRAKTLRLRRQNRRDHVGHAVPLLLFGLQALLAGHGQPVILGLPLV